MDLTNLSSNWKKLQAALVKESFTNPQTSSALKPHVLNHHSRKRKRHDQRPQPSHPPPRKKPKSMTSESTSPSNTQPPTSTTQSSTNHGFNPTVPIGQYIALDCEMVGIAPAPTSALARISIVNYDGALIYDSHVLPQPHQHILDYRTQVSGVRPRDMRSARPFAEVQEQVRQILDGRVVVGHALKHDWAVLGLTHPREDTRDTSRHGPYRKLVGGGTPGLKLLVGLVLGLDIQEGEHSSLEDARAVMALFRRDKSSFAREGEKSKNEKRRGGKYK